MAQVTVEYISIGGNRHPAAADWDRESGLLAFGADCNVALWDPLDGDVKGITALLRGHGDAVNAVKFLTLRNVEGSLLVSGSVDKTIRVWRRRDSNSESYVEVFKVDAHEASINCLEVLPAHNLIVTGAADATVKVWKVSIVEDDNLHVTQFQHIQPAPKFFPLALAVATLDDDGGGLVLAVAGTKAAVQIYATDVRSTGDGSFSHVATLTGHEAWIRALSITRENASDPASDLLLASASQDKYIRLWRIRRSSDLSSSKVDKGDQVLGSLGKGSLTSKTHRFVSGVHDYALTFEALLLGHEDWIYTASWHTYQGCLQLLTASADNSLAVWTADEVSGIWVCSARLGEISAEKGSTSATGSTGGFWCGLWAPDASAVASLGRTGAWRLWQREPESDRWTQRPAVTGHTKDVNSIAWSREGNYLLSTGNDQTTRLHAEWKRDGKTSWHEFSRPQIHGYDLNCIDTLSPTQLISGADEKLLRVFDEPEGVADILHQLCGIPKPSSASLPESATVPSLGLSNKASNPPPPTSTATDLLSTASPPAISQRAGPSHPPLEDTLSRHLLWPEREKLYGHGYEINSVAASHDGTRVATACRASSLDHAVIRLYSSRDWRELKPPLKAHTATVTALTFSPDDAYLVSVGRDRRLCVWARSTSDSPSDATDKINTTGYTLLYTDAKAHARMLLSVSFAALPPRASIHPHPSGASGEEEEEEEEERHGHFFATGGRDKQLKIWAIRTPLPSPVSSPSRDDAARPPAVHVVCLCSIPSNAAITTVAFQPAHHSPGTQERGTILAYGTEDGAVYLSELRVRGAGAVLVSCVQVEGVDLRMSRAITRLAWRPGCTPEGRQLAVASADGALHIFTVSLP